MKVSKISLIFSISLLVTFSYLENCFSQQKDAKALPRKENKQKKTNVDFEDQLIQGELKKPELFYLLQKKQFNFGKLIKLRENFIPEMTKTAEDLDRAK